MNYCVIFLKIKIGTSRIQIGSEFHKQELRSLFGFGVYVKVNGKIKCFNVDLVSRSLNQTSFDVISAFR